MWYTLKKVLQHPSTWNIDTRVKLEDRKGNVIPMRPPHPRNMFVYKQGNKFLAWQCQHEWATTGLRGDSSSFFTNKIIVKCCGQKLINYKKMMGMWSIMKRLSAVFNKNSVLHVRVKSQQRFASSCLLESQLDAIPWWPPSNKLHCESCSKFVYYWVWKITMFWWEFW